MNALLDDYGNQARGYDQTRAASPTVVEALQGALAGAPGHRLADIGGGTGNYAVALRDAGWDPVVLDRSPDMLARARAKGLEVVEADAQALPLEDASVDAAILVAMLHHVPDRARALAEARRVVRPGGKVVALVFTREDTDDLWLVDWWPSARAWMEATHPPEADYTAHLPGAVASKVVYRDLCDGTAAALAGRPEAILEERHRRATSFFERLERDHPEELRAGLERLRADPPPPRPGTATIVAWTRGPAA